MDVVIAQAVGSAVALAFNRRQPPVKLAFNIGSFALASSIGLAVFHAVGSGPLTDPSHWIAAFAGAGVANVVGVFAVAAALTVSEGSLGLRKLRQMLGVSSVVAATNTSVALLAVIIVIADPRAAWLLVVPVATLFFGYRAFIGARQQHESMELLYESTRILQRTPGARLGARPAAVPQPDDVPCRAGGDRHLPVRAVGGLPGDLGGGRSDDDHGSGRCRCLEATPRPPGRAREGVPPELHPARAW